MLLEKKLEAQQLSERLSLLNQQMTYLDEALTKNMTQLMSDKKRQLGQTMVNLDLLSPLQTMLRGYSYVTVNDHIIKSIDSVAKDDKISIHLSDGIVEAVVEEVSKEEEK